MAARSTRNKIRHQSSKIFDDLNSITGHLMNIHTLSGDHSPMLTSQIKLMVEYVIAVEEVFRQFHDTL